MVVGIPEVAAGENSLGVGIASNHIYGVVEEVTSDRGLDKPVTTPACSTVRSSVEVRSQTLNIPYEMTLEYDGEIYKEDGIWDGVITWDVNIKTDQIGVNPVCLESCGE